LRYFFYFSIFLLITKQSIIDLLFFYSLHPDGPRELERDERNKHELHQNKRKPANLYWQAHFADKRDRKSIFLQMMFPKQLLRYGSDTNWMLISAQETRFPRAVVEPPRLAPAGSPLDGFPRRNLVPSSPITLVIKFRTSHKKTAGKLVFHRVCLQFEPPVVSTAFPFLQETVIAAVLVSAKT
jgi:hypothetical protein